ncbi:hypothetical protein QAD02_005023 [Eretmocerus hayati]|uniref:Uncharacterized protein n=1 Tax=Eretmocerus hayati TaxID=131215 RepID=A0ACC2NRJ6_9HYME|nr:hypothetical protein QAD02_005023 [Eretmocerus hayati]
MNIQCAICQDALEAAHDIFVTPCGHVFHFPCLMQWLEKSQTCPECRQKVKRDKLTRIYFNIFNTECIKEDSFTLQQKIDSLSFQNKLKETDLKNCREENVILKKQNSGLREEVKKVENELSHKNSVVHALKEQCQHFKELSDDTSGLKRENNHLKRLLETYENVKTLLCSTTEEVDQILSRANDMQSLSTYVAIMKRELNTSIEKRKELRASVKRLQSELQAIKMEKNSCADEYIKQIQNLQENLALCRSEKDMLQKQLSEAGLNFSYVEASNKVMEETIRPSEASSRKRDTDDEFEIGPVPIKKLKRPNKLKTVPSPIVDDPDVFIVSPDNKKTKENEENSPYLPTKSKGILTSKERPSQHGGFSMKSKKSLLSVTKPNSSAKQNSREKELSLAYDGLGGHSRVEVYPHSSPTKLKRPANDTSKNKKVKLDMGGNRPMDGFVINLT